MLLSDSKNALRLYLLPALVPMKGRTKIINKKPWKPSVPETRDGIFLHVKTPADIEIVLTAKMDAMFEKGLTVQPYILFIGPSLGNITSSLVIINNIQYKCRSVIEAIEFCFKSYQVLDAKYPYEAQHVWYLIQWVIYNYKPKFDPKLPILNEFL